jgi:hypothetical protein
MKVRGSLLGLLGVLSLVAAYELAAQPQAANRFAVIDVYVDSVEPLAAWQFELTEQDGRMQVVGIEGGESASYAEPPFYDRDAVASGAADRIIVADFSLREPAQLPVGRTRVASVHVRLAGDQSPDYQLRLVAAGAADGRSIDAEISLDTRGLGTEAGR